MHYFILFLLVAINIFSYFLMWRDKRAAIRKKRRTPEQTFHFISFFFGALGVWMGSRSPLYHKCAKVRFMRWTYLFLLSNWLLLAVGYFVANSNGW